MHRSSSTQRASDFFASPASSSSSRGGGNETDELPLYDPLSDFAKKERLRMKFAENAVHAIPLVLLLCAAVLWFCSSPDLDMMNNDELSVPRIDGIDGDMDHVHVHHGKMRLLSTPDLGAWHSSQLKKYDNTERYFAF